jgi:eukaryotic-like serine/threonine-protein kinase
MEFTGTDRFSLLAKLGEGGMGIVYEAHDRSRDMRVALKTLRRAKPAHLYRFKREFRALSALSHPNIVTLYELSCEAGHWFFTMELIEGKDVLDHVRAGRSMVDPWPAPSLDDLDTRTSELVAGCDHGLAGVLGAPPDQRIDIGGVVDVDELRRVLIQLGRALDALHAAGLVHRDLKPSNVRVTAEGRVVLMDFGIVAEMGQHGHHGQHGQCAAPAADAIMGTPAYMAPEQGEGGQATAATDWYAFGVLLYNALSGRLPYRGAAADIMRAKKERAPLAPGAFVTGVPEDLQRLCMALLARDPADRPEGAAVLRALGATGGPGARLAADRGGAAALFVGRTAELASLRAAHAAARRGAQCAVVRAPSGMGKSRLVEHFLGELRHQDEPPVVLAGRCHERESLPCKALDGVIDSLCQYLLAPGQRDALLPEAAAALARLFPVLLQVVPDAGVAGLAALAGGDPRDLRVQAMNALRAQLTALAGKGPPIIYIDDLQWADADSLELLLYLLRDPACVGLLLVVTLRSEPVDMSPQLDAALDALAGHDHCRFIDMQPLSEDEQRELMMRLSRRRNFHALIDDRLRAESAGHPMFLVELSRYLDEVNTPLAAQQALHLCDVIWRRVSLLPGPARALVEVIAVAGEPLPLRVLAAAAGLSGTDSERAAAGLCAANLARVACASDEPWLDRFHSKVSEAVMERLSADAIRCVHAQLAHALESCAGTSVSMSTAAHH